MLLSLDLPKSKLLYLLALLIHAIAIVVSSNSTAPLWLRIILSALVLLNFYLSYQCLRSGYEITRLHFQEQAMEICLNSNEWVDIEMTVRRCDRLFVVLALECQDGDSRYFGKRWLLCFYPGFVADKDQRDLRRFIRNF